MALHDDITSDAELAAIVDIKIDFLETWSTGVCTPASPMHSSLCPSQAGKSTSCDCLAGFANLCAREHDVNYWDFTTCMYDHNGGPQAHYKGLESDSTFEATVKNCADQYLATYAFDDLKTCYTGDEGSDLGKASASKASSYGTSMPVWMLVNDRLVSVGHGASMTSWTPLIKAAICEAYEGEKPSTCGGSPTPTPVPTPVPTPTPAPVGPCDQATCYAEVSKHCGLTGAWGACMDCMYANALSFATTCPWLQCRSVISAGCATPPTAVV